MKLKVTNLGGLKHAEVDVKPLTVFIGPNGTHKTWVAYCLYGLLSTLSLRSFGTFLDRAKAEGDETAYLTDVLAGKAEVLAKEIIAAVPHDAYDRIVARSDLTLRVPASVSFELSGNDISSILSTSASSFDESMVSLEIARDEIVDSRSAGNTALGIHLGQSVLLFRSLPDDNVLGIFPVTGLDLAEVKQLVESVLLRFTLSLVNEVIPLPVERAAHLALYRFLDSSRSTTIQRVAEAIDELGKSSRLPARLSVTLRYRLLNILVDQLRVKLPRPQLDFLGLLSAAEFGPTPPIPRDQAFSSIRSLLESAILEGEVSFGDKRELGYAMPGGRTLDLHVASSLVRSVAALDLFLNHGMIRPGDVIVIDEPEMNAHPEAQIQLTELLAILVNRGVRVVVTTHSPYIMDHIGNLTKASGLTGSSRDNIVSQLKLKSPDALLPPSSVAAYLFQGDDSGSVSVQSVMSEDGIADWSTFGDESEYLSTLFDQILAAVD